jgi:hypothetical protein
MSLPLSSDLAAALEHGAFVIIRSRLLRHRCEVTGMKARGLARDFVLARPHRARRMIRGASDRLGAGAERRREIWRHRPTENRWVVVTDRTGTPAFAAGPFPASEWDPLLSEYVILDRSHALEWLRDHIHEFARDDADQC